METVFGTDTALVWAERTARVRMAGVELARFGETEPALAGQCGVELSALEARSILGSGAPDRVCALAGRAAQAGTPVRLAQADLDQVTRLEHLCSMAASNIELRRRALEAETPVGGIVRAVGPVLGGIVVDRVLGVIGSIFRGGK